MSRICPCGGPAMSGSDRCAACNVTHWRDTRPAPLTPTPALWSRVWVLPVTKYAMIEAADYLGMHRVCEDCKAAPSTHLFRIRREDERRAYHRACCGDCYALRMKGGDDLKT